MASKNCRWFAFLKGMLALIPYISMSFMFCRWREQTFPSLTQMIQLLEEPDFQGKVTLSFPVTLFLAILTLQVRKHERTCKCLSMIKKKERKGVFACLWLWSELFEQLNIYSYFLRKYEPKMHKQSLNINLEITGKQ